MNPPTPEQQVLFLRNVQRLLNEGQFVASYKFALLHALADLAVLKGDDSGAPLDLRTKDIAEKFIELYWIQCRPFELGGENTGLILQQNTGKQAAIIRAIVQAQNISSGSLFRFRQSSPAQWKSLISEVDATVCVMPLWKLQTVGEEKMSFLYDNIGSGKKITLKPGVAYCLRAFYGLLRDLIQGAWVRFVQKLNSIRLGNLTDLGTFLFGQERNVLNAYRCVFMEIQDGNCFYCKLPLSKQIDVDHFIPWSRYPADLGHNFVLSHTQCNNSKSDYLAAEEHLAAWMEQIRDKNDKLQTLLLEAELPHDLPASIRIANWAYEQTEKSAGQVWVEKKVLRHLGPEWRQLLSV
jgi:5-methylcytosine-specific restriction endonuclease McrA